MTKDEALRLAEEVGALIYNSPQNPDEIIDIIFTPNTLKEYRKRVIRTALVDTVDTSEERVQKTPECGHEPVLITRLAVPQSNAAPVEPTMRRTTRDEKIVRPGVYEVPVKQEPVAWRNKETGTYCTGGFLSSELDQWQPLYTAPQPRQDVDLTDALKYYADTYCEGWCKENGGTFEDCGGCKARAVLAKYKDKNSA